MEKAGRNDPCPCGSSKKYKLCCLSSDETGYAAPLSSPHTNNPVEPATPSVLEQFNTLYNGRQYVAMENMARALAEHDPQSGFAWKSLGAALRAQGKDALQALQRAVELLPNDASVFNNLGNALFDLKRFNEAETSYQRALQIAPQFADALCNLGNVQTTLGKLTDAAVNLYKALEIQPDHFRARNNLGNAQRDLGQLAEAITSYRRALEINPNQAEVYNNLGNALKDIGQFDDAVTNYRRALEIRPRYAEACCNIGMALRDMSQFDGAVANLRKALEIEPDFAEAHNNLLTTLQFMPDISSEDRFIAHKHFGEHFEAALKPLWVAHANERNPDKRLKIGYVSADFRMHAVAYFIEPVFANHDKSQFEVFCYSNHFLRDAVTDRLMATADHWQFCRDMSDDRLARRIRTDGIDILVDLSGQTAYNRLLAFARKPAPIQITYLGYPGSSGLSAMDYRLTDSYVEPEDAGAGERYVEKLLRLPDSMWCYRPADDMPEITPLPALTNGYITFGSFNNFNKLDRKCISLWAKLLLNIPEARLLIATVPEGSIRQSLTAQFTERGIDAERILFCGKLPPQEFRRKLQEVDIALDPFPVNGATTTCEALWLGVPVLTLVGQRFLTRAGLSILSAAGLSDFAAATEEDFIKTAALLASNLHLLAGIRIGLREHLRNAPFFDQVRFTRNLENTYRVVWTEWCREGRP